MAADVQPHTVVHLASMEANPLLEQYMASLAREIARVEESSVRESFLQEVRVHLEQSIQAREERGLTPEEATREALETYGDVRENSAEFLASWFQYENRTTLSKRFGRANLIAFGWFQAAEVTYLLLLELNVFLPNEAMYKLPWRMSPAQIRHVWPAPLPFPDLTPSFLLTIGYPILAPIVAGILVGRMVPARGAAAVYRGLMPLILVSFVTGALLLPMTEGLLFALFQVAFWLPVGCFTAHVSSILARRWYCKAHDRSNNVFEHK